MMTGMRPPSPSSLEERSISDFSSIREHPSLFWYALNRSELIPPLTPFDPFPFDSRPFLSVPWT